MSIFKVKTVGPTALALLGVSVCSLTAGCGPKEAATTTPAKGQGPVAGAGAANVKVTPEQEAARQNAIKQGPAVEAALRRQQGQ
ncbi:MAG: hypothetical protein V4671_33810 [Armatimonadota bacterium]